MQPYQQVKDLRTGHAMSNIDGVLGGDLDGFMESWLVARAEGTLGEGVSE
jgi:peptide chain release factor 2